MIHIVFQEADIAALQRSFELDGSLRGDVIHIKDDFAVGPLGDIYSAEGIEARKEWWRNVLAGGDYQGMVESGSVDDPATVVVLKEKLDKEDRPDLWIWAAQNKHDVCGYYWLITQLTGYQSRVYILYLNNLPFINEKGGLFYPVNLFQIPAREFVKAKKLARPVTPSEFDLDAEEWKKLCLTPGEVRLLEGGKKLKVEADSYYDDALLALAGKEWMKVPRFMTVFFNHARETTGDAYLLWRLKLLVASGELEAKGELKNMKDFEIRLKVQEPAIQEQM